MDVLSTPFAAFVPLLGEWTGVNRLWFEPGTPVRESTSAAVIEPVAQGRGLTVRYTWAYEGAPQDGMLLIMADGEGDGAGATAVLVDSWHVGNAYMACTGTAGAEGVSVMGSYPAPEGPDWGWRTTLEAVSPSSWRLRMYNIEPDADETLAVEGLYEARTD